MQQLQDRLLFQVPEKPPIEVAASQLPSSRASVSQVFGMAPVGLSGLTDEDLAWRELLYLVPLDAVEHPVSYAAEQAAGLQGAERFRQQLYDTFATQLDPVLRYTEAEQQARQPLVRFTTFVENLRLGLQDTASRADLAPLFELVLALPNLNWLEMALAELVFTAAPTCKLWQQWLQLLDPDCTIVLADQTEYIHKLCPTHLCPPGNLVALQLAQNMLCREVFSSSAQPFYNLARIPDDAVALIYLLSTTLPNPDLVSQLYLYATGYANAELLATPPELSLTALLSTWIERTAEVLFALALGTEFLGQMLAGLDIALANCCQHFRRLTRCAELLGVRCSGTVFTNFTEWTQDYTEKRWSCENRNKPWLPAAGTHALYCNNIATMLGIVKADCTLPPDNAGDLALCRMWVGEDEARFAGMCEQALARPDEPISRKLALSLLAEQCSRDSAGSRFQTARRHASAGVIMPAPQDLKPVFEETEENTSPKKEVEEESTDGWPDI